MNKVDVATLGSSEDLGTTHVPGAWMADPRRSLMITGGKRAHYYIDNEEVSEDEYRAIDEAQAAADRVARKERAFDSPDDAFAYAAGLDDGVVLDWGGSYAAMEREGLKIGFCIEPHDQPVITPADLLTRPGPQYILARRDPIGSTFGACCTNFMDSSQSWSENEVEVIEDGTGHYQKGQRLHVRVMGAMGERASVGRNWRMKLLKLEDIQMVISTKNEVYEA